VIDELADQGGRGRAGENDHGIGHER
jgi:hypothetical protein